MPRLTPEQEAQLRKKLNIPEGVPFVHYDDVKSPASAPEAPKPETSSPVGAGLREFARSVLPTGGATALAIGGAKLGAPFFPPVGSLVGAGIGGVGGYMLSDWLQDEAINATPWGVQYQASRAKDQAEQPLASSVGRVAANLPSSVFAPGQTIRGLHQIGRGALGKTLTAAEKAAAQEAAIMTGVGGAISAAPGLMEGRAPTVGELGEGVASSILFGQPRRFFPGAPKAPPVQENAATGQPEAKAGIVEPPVTFNSMDFYGTEANAYPPGVVFPSEVKAARDATPPGYTKSKPAAARESIMQSRMSEADKAELTVEQRLIQEQQGPTIDLPPTDSSLTVRPKATTQDVLAPQTRQPAKASLVGKDILDNQPPPAEDAGVTPPPAEDPVKAAAEVAQQNHEAAKAQLESVKAAVVNQPDIGSPEQKLNALETVRQEAKAAGQARNELVEASVPARDWDLFSEELRGDLDSFGPARNTGKTDYELMDAADRFVDFARKQPAGRPLLDSLKEFSQQDQASSSQIRKLRESLKGFQAKEAAPIKPPEQPASATRYRVGKNPQPHELVEVIPPQPGDLPGEQYLRLRNPKTGETGVYEASTVKEIGGASPKFQPESPLVSKKRVLTPEAKRKIEIAEEHSANFLARGNELSEKGQPAKAEQFYDKSAKWLMRANELRESPKSYTKETSQFQPASSLVGKQQPEHPYQFKVEYEYPDGRRGAVVAAQPAEPGSPIKGPHGDATVVRSVPYDRAYQLANDPEAPMRAEDLLFAPVNERFLKFTEGVASRHNVNVRPEDRIMTPDGKLAAGVAYAKERLVKLNPSRAGLDTGLHEVAHVFLDDLRVSSTAQERSLYQRGLDAFGGDAERLTEAVGLRASELMSRRIEGALLGRFREWAKDFWSYIKSKWGAANSQDFRALLARRMLDAEPVVSKVSDPGDTGPQFQESSRAHQLRQEAEKQNMLSRGIDNFMRMGQSLADAVKRIGPEGEHLDAHFTHKVYDTADHYDGKYTNQALLAARKLKAKEREGLRAYMEAAREGKPTQKLNDAQTAVLGRLRTLFSEFADDANTAGVRVIGKDGKPRPIQKDPNYFPHIPSGEAMNFVTQKPNSPQARALKKSITDWWEAGGLQGESAAFSKEEAQQAFNALISGKTEKSDGGYRALERAEGMGLPPEWREQDFTEALRRYFTRGAKKMAWFMHVEADTPENRITRSILNAPDQYGSFDRNARTLADGVTPAESRIGNEDVKALLRDVLGSYTRNERNIDATNRVIKAGMMQTLTGQVDFLSSIFLAAQHLGVSDYFLLPKAFAGIKNGIAAGYRTNRIQPNAIRAQSNMEGAMGYSHLGTFARKANTLADAINTVTGRDAFERWGRGLLMEWGKLKVLSELGHKVGNPKHNAKFLDDMLGQGNWEKPLLDKGMDGFPPELIEQAAAKFVDSVQGTYDARGLPAWALQGQLAPFLSLAKWNIEKMNNFKKKVFLPATRGDFKPLLMLTAAGALGGEAIEELREFMTTRKPSHAEWSEIAEAGGEGLMYRMMATMSYAGYAGALTEIGKQILDLGKGSEPMGFKFPLVEALANGFDRASDAAVAIDRGENPLEVLWKIPTQLGRDHIQTVRLAIAWMDEDTRQQIAEQNKQRDLRVYRELHGIPNPAAPRDVANPFTSEQEKRFKRSQNPAEAAALVPELMERAARKSGGDPEQFQRNVRALRTPAGQPYPSARSRPEEFRRFMEFLGDTQGQDVMQKALMDYQLRQQMNQARGQMLPRF